MRRLVYLIVMMLPLVGGYVFTTSPSNKATAFDNKDLKTASLASKQGLQPKGLHDIKITPWGPSQESIDAAKAGLIERPAVKAYLKGTRFRLISFELLDKGKINGSIEPPDSYRAWLFDYTNNRAMTVTGRFNSLSVKVEPTLVQ